MALLDWPTDAPTLHLLERFWTFVTQQWLDSTDDPDRESFQRAILTGLEPAPSQHQDALDSLLPVRFQTSQDVPISGEPQRVARR